MPNVIDMNGKVVRDVQTPEIFEKDYSKKTHTIFRAVYRELGKPARRHRFDQEARRSFGRRSQAVEAKGNRPRPSGFDPFAAVAPWWRYVRTAAAFATSAI